METENQKNATNDAEVSPNLAALLECRCHQKYSIEKHGDGHAIYFGRCGHMHGHNLAQLTECNREDMIKSFAKKLNQPEILFQSDASGLWYENQMAAGYYSTIKIAGKTFKAI